MYGQTMVLAALSTAGALAAPQMCACPPGIPSAAAGSVGATPSPYSFPYAPPSSTSTSTVTEHLTSTVTATASSGNAGQSTITITEHDTVTVTQSVPATTSTETSTVTSTVTSTQTVTATNTPQAPSVSSGSVVPSNAPYYPTYPGGPSGVAGPTGGTGYSNGPSAPQSSSTTSRSQFSYPVPSPRPSNTYTPSPAPSAPGSNSATTPSYSYTHPVYTPTTPISVPTSSAPSDSTSVSAPYSNPYSYTPSPVGPSAPGFSSSVTTFPHSIPSHPSGPYLPPIPVPTTYPTAPASETDSVSAAASSTGQASTYVPSGSATATHGPSPSGSFPQSISLTNAECFSNGAGNHSTSDTVGVPAESAYVCHNGPASAFPNSDKWMSYNDMKKLHNMLGQTWCSNGVLNTDSQTAAVYRAIEEVGAASLVDKRVILAHIIQESSGCVNVPNTNNGVDNRGVMQSHAGVAFVGNGANAEDQYQSILQMISDGVEGTHYKTDGTGGDGLVQVLDHWGNFYEAAREYNSGSVDQSNLSNPMGATASYCSDTANYLQGWDGVASATRTSCYPAPA